MFSQGGIVGALRSHPEAPRSSNDHVPIMFRDTAFYFKKSSSFRKKTGFEGMDKQTHRLLEREQGKPNPRGRCREVEPVDEGEVIRKYGSR